jgi:dTDP-glucose 4,6-dehydratase
VSRQFEPPREVRVAKVPAPGAVPHRYVPSTSRARNELGLDASVGLDDALMRTVVWYRAMAGSPHV